MSVRKKYSISESKQLGLSYRLLRKASDASNLKDLCQRKKRKDAIDTDDLQKADHFYRRGDISRTRPDARNARKTGQSYMATRVTEMSYNASYDTFREECPDFKVSKTKFRQLRLTDMQPSYRNKKRNCMCEHCANIDLKLEILSRYPLQDICIKDRYEVSRLTLSKRPERRVQESLLGQKV